MMIFLFQFILLSGVLTLTYFALRKFISAKNRRQVLICIPVITAIALLVKLLIPVSSSAIYQLPIFETKAINQELFRIIPNNNSVNYIILFYLFIVGILVIRLILNTKSKFQELKSLKRSQIGGIYLVESKTQSNYSFFNFIHVFEDLHKDEKELIIEHEMHHIELNHMKDLVFYEILQIVFWFNPFIYLLKKELIVVHEFQVDEIMFKKHKVDYLEFLLCHSLGTSSIPYLLTNQFLTKKMLIKRINFMNTKIKNKMSILLAIPVVAIGFMLVSTTYTEKLQPNVLVSTSFTKVEKELDKMPEFKGGQEALVKYLTENINYPQKAKDEKIEGKVFISFIVESTGKVSKCKIKQGTHELLDQEALRVVSSMPDWIPGEKGGKTVNAEMILPISFKL